MILPLPAGIFPNGGTVTRGVTQNLDRDSEIRAMSENGARHYRVGTATDFNTEAAAVYSAETHRLALEKVNVYLTRVKFAQKNDYDGEHCQVHPGSDL